MSRYTTTVLSSAALAANTNFAGLFAASNGGGKIRRGTIGTVTNTATTPTSQQLLVGIFRATAAGTSSGSATISQMDPNSRPAVMTVPTAWSVQPTLASAASWQIPFNTQSGADLPWEFLEEWVITAGTANGLVFQNLGNAIPSGHQISLAWEWEE